METQVRTSGQDGYQRSEHAGRAPTRTNWVSLLFPTVIPELLSSLRWIMRELTAHAGIRIRADVNATNAVNAVRIRSGSTVEVVEGGGAKIRGLSVGTVVRGRRWDLGIGTVGAVRAVRRIRRDPSVGTVVALPIAVLSVSRRTHECRQCNCCK